jgi:hypothetical protein
MTDFIKYDFNEREIQQAEAEINNDGVCDVIISTYETEIRLTTKELVDLLTLINRKEESIKMDKWLAEKVGK